MLLGSAAGRFPAAGGRLALHREWVFLIPEACDTANHVCTESSVTGYGQPLLTSHTFNVGPRFKRRNTAMRKTTNADKSVRCSGPQAERRATLQWKTGRNEFLFLQALGFLKTTFPSSSYWQRYKPRKYFLFCKTKSCKGGQGRNIKYILKIWNQNHVESRGKIQQTGVNKEEISGSCHTFSLFIPYKWNSVLPHRKATASLHRSGICTN